MHESLINDQYIHSYEPSINTIDNYLNHLRFNYHFGDRNFNAQLNSTRIDALFNIAIRPVLQWCVATCNVDVYARIDEFLFVAYICPFEDADWFSKAFWNVNHYGSALADQVNLKYSQEIEKVKPSDISGTSLLIIFKGPNQLAHSEVLNDFIHGCAHLDNIPRVFVLYLDAPAPKTVIKNVHFTSFSTISKTSIKIENYLKLTAMIKFKNIVWVASCQHLMLYMGLQRSNLQTYWTMKRHSIVHSKIQKYAAVVSAYRNTTFNHAFWFGGRYRLKTAFSSKSKEELIKSLSPTLQAKISQSTVILGSFARPQKYLSLEYWKGIEFILRHTNSTFFIYGTLQLPSLIQDFISQSSVLKEKSFNFGWLDGRTADLCALIDLYIDNIPFASGMTASQCIWAGGIYLGTQSEINKESSFINILCDSYFFETGKNLNEDPSVLSKVGVSNNFNATLSLALAILDNPQLGKKIAANQLTLLKKMNTAGEKYFTKDYLDFFLESN